MTRRAVNKVDTNQQEIVTALRKAGATVQSLAAIGRGCPDILVSYHGGMFIVEIKRDKKKPNALQEKWHAAWQSPVHVVRSVADALGVIGVA